jgi:hypothetical protein
VAVAEDEGGGAEADGVGGVVAANVGADEGEGGQLEVFDGIGDDAAAVVAGVLGGEGEGFVGVAPVIESSAAVAEGVHDLGDALALGEQIEGGALVAGEGLGRRGGF